MKAVRLFAALCAAALCLCALCGCGGAVTVDTVLSLTSSGAGRRVMTVRAAAADVEKYVTAGADGVEKLIVDALPADLDFRVEEKGADLRYIFTLEFSSPDDYRAAVERLLALTPDGAARQPGELEISDGQFCTGLCVEEEFTSVDLLGWLVAAAENEKLVPGASGGMLKAGRCAVTFDSNTYETPDKIVLDKRMWYSPSALDVSTGMDEGGRIWRTVRFVMSNSVDTLLTLKGTPFGEWLDGQLPDGASVDMQPGDEETVYTVTLPPGTAVQMEDATARLMDAPATRLEVTMESSDTRGRVRIGYTERIDTSLFIAPDASGAATSTVTMPPRTALAADAGVRATQTAGDDGRTSFTYTPDSAREAQLFFDWAPYFSKAALSAQGAGGNLGMTLTLEVADTLPAAAATVLDSAVKLTLPESALLDVARGENGKVYTVAYAAADGRVLTRQLNTLLEMFGGGDFTVTTRPLERGSRLFTGVCFEMRGDLSALTTGDIDVGAQSSVVIRAAVTGVDDSFSPGAVAAEGFTLAPSPAAWIILAAGAVIVPVSLILSLVWFARARAARRAATDDDDKEAASKKRRRALLALAVALVTGAGVVLLACPNYTSEARLVRDCFSALDRHSLRALERICPEESLDGLRDEYGQLRGTDAYVRQSGLSAVGLLPDGAVITDARLAGVARTDSPGTLLACYEISARADGRRVTVCGRDEIYVSAGRFVDLTAD